MVRLNSLYLVGRMKLHVGATEEPVAWQYFVSSGHSLEAHDNTWFGGPLALFTLCEPAKLLG